MPVTAALPELEQLLPALARAVAGEAAQWAGVALVPLPDRGLAHHHVALEGTGVLARVPKQSQLQLPPERNLAYQAACFERAGASGHTPAMRAVLAPRPELPRGALLVEHIDGRAAELPRDLPAIMAALASVHALPLPPAAQRPPVWADADPLRALTAEIEDQARYLDAAALDAAARGIVDRELQRLRSIAATPDRPDTRLISFDAHPGNFLIRADGSAVLVDLEKCRYSYPALDLAHATLYTSTTWEPGIFVVLSPDQIADCYREWQAHFTGPADQQWQLPLRRAMWLWSVTWCAKWRVVSGDAPARDVSGEDWSRTRSEQALTEHFRERVDDYLDAAVIERITAEFARW